MTTRPPTNATPTSAAASSSTCPAPRCPTPPRFLPAFDNALLSQADSYRIISDEDRESMFIERLMRGVLLDCFACGTWRTERARRKVTLEIEPFERLSREDTDAPTQEGERFVRFVGEDADEFDIRFAGES